MTPDDVLKYFGTKYNFHKQTGIRHSNLVYWFKRGYVPEGAQYKIERLTDGKLKTQWTKEE